MKPHLLALGETLLILATMFAIIWATSVAAGIELRQDAYNLAIAVTALHGVYRLKRGIKP